MKKKNSIIVSGLVMSCVLILFVKNNSFAAKQYDQITRIILPTTEILGTLTTSSRELARVIVQLGVPGGTEDEMSKLKDEIFEYRTKFDVGLRKYNNIQTGEGANSTEVIRSKWNAWSNVVDEMINLGTSKKSGDRAKFQKMLHSEFRTTRDELFYMLQQRSEFQWEMAAEWSDELLKKCQK